MGFIKEFKEFALKGNVIDLAVGVIIGGAFGKITDSLVKDIIMPPVGLLVGGVDFKDIKLVLKDSVMDEAGKKVSEAVTFNIGNFIQVIVDFSILAFAIFLMIKAINTLKQKMEKEKEVAAAAVVVAPPEPSKEELLLTEIRDILKSSK